MIVAVRLVPAPSRWADRCRLRGWPARQLVGGSEVIGHQVGGRLGIAAIDRRRDLAMFGDKARDTSRLSGNGRSGDSLMAVAEGVVLADQQFIVVGGHDCAMEAAMGKMNPAAPAASARSCSAIDSRSAGPIPV
jgi:hypothetical protein